MKTDSAELESAVAAHLARPGDFGPKHPLGQYRPAYPSPTSRFDPRVATLVMAYYGAQHLDAENPVASAALDRIAGELGATDGPGHWDRARVVDAAGFTNTITIAYWDDPAVFDRWHAAYGAGWTSLDTFDESVGYFAEIIRPDVSRFETISSTWDAREGVSAISTGFSGPVEEHAYWGAARDRIAAGHYDPLHQKGELTVAVDGPLRVVSGHDNIALIRSGQDVTHVHGEELEFYRDEIEPGLTAGMEYLRDEGTAVGCYSNRFMTVLDDTGAPVAKNFGLSWWADLRALENWSSEHPSHVQIFGTAARHLRKFGPDAKLRLYHEITVTRSDEQSFVYLNCHDGTGLLNAVMR